MKPVVWTFWGICVANGATPTAPVALHDPRGVQGVAKAHLRGVAGSYVTRTSAALGHTWHGRPMNRGALLANGGARECPAGHQSAQMGTSRTLGGHVINRQPPRPCRSEKTSAGPDIGLRGPLTRPHGGCRPRPSDQTGPYVGARAVGWGCGRARRGPGDLQGQCTAAGGGEGRVAPPRADHRPQDGICGV